jgi:hypothetical protein
MDTRRCHLFAKPDVFHRGTAKHTPVSAGDDICPRTEYDRAKARRSFIEQHDLTTHRSDDGQLDRDARDERGPAARREHRGIGAQIAFVEGNPDTPAPFDE